MMARFTEITGREVRSSGGDALDALINALTLMDLRQTGSKGTHQAWTSRWAASGVVGSPSAKAIRNCSADLRLCR
jgi:hypothetical protein